MATKTKTDDLSAMSEPELLELSQRIKSDVIEPAREQRRAIVQELGRRATGEGLRAKLGDLTPEERAMARRLLDEADK